MTVKVLAITNSINKIGGASRYSSAVLENYQNFDIEYKVVCEDREQDNHGIVSILLLKSHLNFISNIFKVRKTAKNFDIVHAFDAWPYGVYSYFAVLGTKKQLFITGIGTYSVQPFNSKIKSFFLKKAYRRAKQIFCISNYTKKRILEKIKLNNIGVIFLGASRIALLSPSELDKYRIQYEFKNKYPIFLTVGDIKSRKGQYNSLQAINKLKSEFPHLLYIILGSDEDKDYLKLINDFIIKHDLVDNVKVVNQADDRSLAFFYQVSDIFLLNSNNQGDSFEGFGLALLEAAQYGLPVIGSRECGIEDALQDSYNGYLSKQGDVDDIYNKIVKILSLDKEKLANNSKEFAKRFSWHKTVSQYYEYYKKN